MKKPKKIDISQDTLAKTFGGGDSYYTSMIFQAEGYNQACDDWEKWLDTPEAVWKHKDMDKQIGINEKEILSILVKTQFDILNKHGVEATLIDYAKAIKENEKDIIVAKNQRRVRDEEGIL